MINEPLRRWRTVGADLLAGMPVAAVASTMALDRLLAQWDGVIDECCG
jgi:hypothetical protein